VIKHGDLVRNLQDEGYDDWEIVWGFKKLKETNTIESFRDKHDSYWKIIKDPLSEMINKIKSI